MNYRILYFFHGRDLAVLAHAITKEGEEPSADIDGGKGGKGSDAFKALTCGNPGVGPNHCHERPADRLALRARAGAK